MAGVLGGQPLSDQMRRQPVGGGVGIGAGAPLGLVMAGGEEVAVGAAREELAQPHADPVGGKVGDAENHHRQGADGGGALRFGPGKARDHGEGGDDAIVAAIDDLLEVVANRVAGGGHRHGETP